MSHRHPIAWDILWVALLALALPRAAFGTMPPRSGVVPPDLSSAFSAGLFQVPVPPALSLATTQAQGLWVVPIIMVDFTDQPLSSLSTPASWDRALFDTTGSTATGSVFDYYRWVSRGRIRVLGKVVATVHLAHDKAYYANGSSGLSYLSTPHNAYGVIDDALRACDGGVDFSAFDQDRDGYVDMVWIVHSGLGGESTVARDNLWSFTSEMDQWTAGGAFVTNDPIPGGGSLKMRINRFSMLPEMSAFHAGRLAEIGVYCHEFGHALGLPDLYDTSGGRNVGPGNWSLMSTGAYGTDGASPESPAHMGAWPMLFLGWADSQRPSEDTTLTLAPIEDGGSVLELWFQGESNPEHFLLEAREAHGFDRHLLQPGLLIYHVDESLIGQRLGGNRVNAGSPPGLWLIEGDGGQQLIDGTSHGDPSDPFPGTTGRVALDDGTSPSLRGNGNLVTNLGLSDIGRVSGGSQIHARVRSFGWQTARPLRGDVFTPIAAFGPATRAVPLLDSRVAFVASETRGGGRAQVWLHLRTDAVAWLPPIPVSQSAGSAIEPTVARLPGGGFAIVWSDTRDGANELYYRSFVDGVWSAELRLTSLTGTSRNPALSSDPAGGLHLAWLYTDAGIPQVMFMHFSYQSPGATPITITTTANRPDAPAVAAAPDGGSYLLWPERSASPTKLWFSHFSPDSGAAPAERLTTFDNTQQQSANVAVGPDGTLHTVWLVTNVGQNELRYQRREAIDAPPSVRDTVLERRGESIQNVMLAADPTGGLHAVFEISSSGTSQIRYKQYMPSRGWDLVSTAVTRASDGIANRPQMIAPRDQVVDVIYLGYPNGTSAWMERPRDATVPGTPTAVPVIAPTVAKALRAWPNPLRAGDALRLRIEDGALSEGSRVTLFDIGGRRVSEARLARDGEGWSARWPASESARWSAGVYLARISGRGTVARLVVLR